MGKRKLGGRYKLGRTLGVGAFGKVKEGVSLKTNEKVAIKILNKSDIRKYNLINSVKNEVSSLKALPTHRHVVNLLEVLESKERLYLILELVEGGELFDKIKTEGKFSEDNARHYYRQLISGLEFMHKHNICHRDLKLENLLVDKNGILKITDFGLSGLQSGGDDVFKTTLGSPNYVAPEVLIGKGYNGFKADIWSSGVILYVLLAGFLPFDEDNAKDLFDKICTADFRYPQTFSKVVITLIDNILTLDPDKRYTIKHIKQHNWFQSNIKGDEYFEIDETPLIITAETADFEQIIDDKTPRFDQKTQKGFFKEKFDEQKIDDNDKHTKKKNNQKTGSLKISFEQDPNDPDIGKQKKPKDKEYQDALDEDFWRVVGRGPSQSSSSNNSPNTNKKNNLEEKKVEKPSTPSLSYSNNSDVTGSEYESPESTPNPVNGIKHDTEPTVMTAFDLIGIVSTQMLNNVFTRSLNDGNNVKKSTRFMSNLSPKKILFFIQESIDRIADCTCKIIPDKYEVKSVKRQGHRIIHTTIKIFSTPGKTQYMVECRRISGNIFRYYDFYDEFEHTFNEVVQNYKRRESYRNVIDSKVTSINNSRKKSNSKSNTLQPILPLQLKENKKKKRNPRSSSEALHTIHKNQSQFSTQKRSSITLEQLPEKTKLEDGVTNVYKMDGSHTYHSSNLSNTSTISQHTHTPSNASSQRSSIQNAYNNSTPSYNNENKFFTEDINDSPNFNPINTSNKPSFLNIPQKE